MPYLKSAARYEDVEDSGVGHLRDRGAGRLWRPRGLSLGLTRRRASPWRHGRTIASGQTILPLWRSFQPAGKSRLGARRCRMPTLRGGRRSSTRRRCCPTSVSGPRASTRSSNLPVRPVVDKDMDMVACCGLSPFVEESSVDQLMLSVSDSDIMLLDRDLQNCKRSTQKPRISSIVARCTASCCLTAYAWACSPLKSGPLRQDPWRRG